jgi:ribonucleotide monophosphatase NagD (HAD superfamily)
MTALLLDLNGVLFEDRTPFPGAVEADVALTTAPGVSFSAP